MSPYSPLCYEPGCANELEPAEQDVTYWLDRLAVSASIRTILVKVLTFLQRSLMG